LGQSSLRQRHALLERKASVCFCAGWLIDDFGELSSIQCIHEQRHFWQIMREESLCCINDFEIENVVLNQFRTELIASQLFRTILTVLFANLFCTPMSNELLKIALPTLISLLNSHPNL
jgi:hypothetical protein